MAGNTFGSLFRVTTFGESHGGALGVVIDGCPAGLEVDLSEIQKDLDRRRPGQSRITTQRKELDKVEILSGVFEGKTTGAPIAAIVFNEDQRSKDYVHIKDQYRPAHADFTYDQKYGHRDYRGGGRTSARETLARVIAGSIAKAFLKKFKIDIQAYVSKVGPITADIRKIPSDLKQIRARSEKNAIRCPDPDAAKKMISYIEKIKGEGDTTGGVVSCIVRGVNAGLGEPVFDKLHADLGKGMLSINAVKGFEYGSGFKGTELRGSEHNDIFVKKGKNVATESNHSGGIQGGISNGMDIVFNVAFKPVATLMKPQKSLDRNKNQAVVLGKGRHDPCVVPRAVPIVEAMAAITIADHLLRNRASKIK